MYAYDFDINNDKKDYSLERLEDMNSENHEYFFFNDYEINEDDNYDHNELIKEFKDNEEKDELKINSRISGKSTNVTQKKQSQQSEKPIIDVILTNYQNQLQYESQEIIEENESNNSIPDKTNSPTRKRNINKLSDDYIRRKCKHLILDAISDLINCKIFYFYKGKIGSGPLIKRLQKLNSKQYSELKIEFNKTFLYKSIKEIFSDKISTKINNHNPDHNKNLIESLLNENNINIKNYFTKLFNLTFIQCMHHYIGAKSYEELIEMKVFNDIKQKMIEDKEEIEYIKSLELYLQNYENNINRKRSRKAKKNKKNKV